MNFSDRIEDYEISRDPLGKGGFATVYKARCRKTGIEVAIKMIDRRLTEEAGMVERVREEIKIHTRLKHPAIIELYTFFEDVQYVYLVLELAQNGELQRYFKKNHKVMNDVEASRIMRQVVEGLYYLHSQGILHRDLSLSNLLLSHDMHVKIGDFGLAKRAALDVAQKNFTMCGTPNYISPEVASRTAHGPPADIWGLGCMLYTLLVGRPPFETETVKSTLTRIVMSDYILPAHLSSEAKDLIQKLLKKNPLERITLPDIMVHPFMTKLFPATKTFSKPMTMEQRKVLQQFQKQSNTLTSQDSGMQTMSSDGYSNKFGNSTGQFGNSRSQSEEQLAKRTCIPNSNQQQNSRHYNKNEYSAGSCYGSLNENSTSSKHKSLPRSILENKNKILTEDNVGGNTGENMYNREMRKPFLNHNFGSMCNTESIHREYCTCDDPVCRAKRKVYDDEKTTEKIAFQSRNTGNEKYDYFNNKKQIDPGGTKLENEFGRVLQIDDKKMHEDNWNRGMEKDGIKSYEMGHRRVNPISNNISAPQSRSNSRGRDRYHNQNGFPYHSGDYQERRQLRPISSNENYSDDGVPFNGNIGVPPLNSVRLQPTRHRTKNAILSITASGEVVIEFIKRKGRAKEERVVDVCRISEDGLRIVLYQPDQGRGVPVRSEPPPLPMCGTDALHGYETLPEQHCRKYLYAVRFINLVKAKTPKVTFYSRLAKCQLMETGTDFEANFYEGGKISKNTVEGIKITANDNCPYLCPYDQIPTIPTNEMRLMWEHFEECMSQCQRLNSLLSWENPCGQNFPIVVGRRPAPGIAQLHSLDHNKENCPRLEPLELTPFTPSYGQQTSGISTSHSDPPLGFAIAGSSNHRHRASHHVPRKALEHQPIQQQHPTPANNCTPKTVEVPGIGIATQLPSGEVQVQYNDGAVLTVPPMSPGAGVHYAVGGYGAHFRPEDDLPPKLRERLEKISTVIEHLKMAQPAMAHIGRKRPILRN